jgi:hypothetical protein
MKSINIAIFGFLIIIIIAIIFSKEISNAINEAINYYKSLAL